MDVEGAVPGDGQELGGEEVAVGGGDAEIGGQRFQSR